jgi:hypothetical protein
MDADHTEFILQWTAVQIADKWAQRFRVVATRTSPHETLPFGENGCGFGQDKLTAGAQA